MGVCCPLQASYFNQGSERGSPRPRHRNLSCGVHRPHATAHTPPPTPRLLRTLFMSFFLALADDGLVSPLDLISVFCCREAQTHLDLDGPGEVADVDEEGDVGVVAEVKVLVGEALLELLDVAPGDDGDLLPGLGAGWRTKEKNCCLSGFKLWDVARPPRSRSVSAFLRPPAVSLFTAVESS